MAVYLECGDETLWADDLVAAFAFIQDRYNKGARAFFMDTAANP